MLLSQSEPDPILLLGILGAVLAWATGVRSVDIDSVGEVIGPLLIGTLGNFGSVFF